MPFFVDLLQFPYALPWSQLALPSDSSRSGQDIIMTQHIPEASPSAASEIFMDVISGISPGRFQQCQLFTGISYKILRHRDKPTRGE